MQTQPPDRHRAPRTGGFTLAELMVVIVIIGLLATLVVPNVVRKLFVANEAKAKADIIAIESALDEYAISNSGRYPESLEALVTEDENGFKYLKRDSIPTDPWGHEYVYEPPSGGQPLRVLTYGDDGVPGGEGTAKDMDNIMIRNEEV
jgi:general secretion pathway protein G